MIPTSVDGVELRALRRSDRREWDTLIAESWEWMKPWEPTTEEAPEPHIERWRFRYVYQAARRDARRGTHFLFAITARDGEIVGCIKINGVTWGPLCGCSLGYWISPKAAGQGIMPAAVRAILDFLFTETAMHRVEICMRPENAASVRVAEKLGLSEEGYRTAFLHIDGDWRDHRVFVALREEWSCT